MNIEIVIPVFSTAHYMLQDCVRNVRETTGKEPIVWSSQGNVAVARQEATDRINADALLFLDTDAFPVEKDWHQLMARTMADTGAAIVSPNEILWFSETDQHQIFTDLPDKAFQILQPNVAGMCLLVRKGWGVWDTNIGLTNGLLGPCIEDTDFAHSIQAQGGSHFKNPAVHVLHKDRGAATFDEWQDTDEMCAYRAMVELIGIKWHPNYGGHHDFFRALKGVPAKPQRSLAPGWNRRDLLNCYLAVAQTLHKEDINPVGQALAVRMGLMP